MHNCHESGEVLGSALYSPYTQKNHVTFLAPKPDDFLVINLFNSFLFN